MNLKPRFIERMKMLLGNDFEDYLKTLEKPYINSIRCNTLKISTEELKKRLEKKWKVMQPFKEHPEIFHIISSLEPGEIGKALEYSLGYYYVQETSSMMPPLVINPDENDIVLDIAASPGSKTTQIAAMMNNKGILIANDIKLDRIRILSTNLQRCGVSNCIITQEEGTNLCKKIEKTNFRFNKILVDAPCSGEGTLRTNPKTAVMFNENLIEKFSKTQKIILSSALKILSNGGEAVYSTCTHAPEENEEVINYILENFNVKLEEIKLPVKFHHGITEWKGKHYNNEVKKCARIYPQDNNTEGFFICKMRKLGEKK
ncbi:MAG: RsmB/NOP family class I SAM-dependent RNA methyltransferase [Candidatus Pacearchaeota archaeon]